MPHPLNLAKSPKSLQWLKGPAQTNLFLSLPIWTHFLKLFPRLTLLQSHWPSCSSFNMSDLLLPQILYWLCSVPELLLSYMLAIFLISFPQTSINPIIFKSIASSSVPIPRFLLSCSIFLFPQYHWSTYRILYDLLPYYISHLVSVSSPGKWAKWGQISLFC